MTKNWKNKLVDGDLVTIRYMLSKLHAHSRAHIHEEGAVELRDMSEDFINRIDSYGEKHVQNWKPQDMGAI